MIYVIIVSACVCTHMTESKSHFMHIGCNPNTSQPVSQSVGNQSNRIHKIVRGQNQSQINVFSSFLTSNSLNWRLSSMGFFFASLIWNFSPITRSHSLSHSLFCWKTNEKPTTFVKRNCIAEMSNKTKWKWKRTQNKWNSISQTNYRKK